jgi:nucleoside-diphosphate kinase
MERTLILVKPDAFARNLTGEIIARFERKGLRLVAMKLMTMSRDLAARHYAEHEGKGFYLPLIEFITGGPVVALVAEGERAIEAVRGLCGATDGVKAAAGTLRGDFSSSNRENLVHASDSPESAQREIAIFFPGLPPEA